MMLEGQQEWRWMMLEGQQEWRWRMLEGQQEWRWRLEGHGSGRTQTRWAACGQGWSQGWGRAANPPPPLSQPLLWG